MYNVHKAHVRTFRMTRTRTLLCATFVRDSLLSPWGKNRKEKLKRRRRSSTNDRKKNMVKSDSDHRDARIVIGDFVTKRRRNQLPILETEDLSMVSFDRCD